MPDRVLQEFSSVYGERFQWPQPGSPVKLAYDADFGGVLGFEVNGSLYSSLETLPKEFHAYVVEGGNASKVCRNGHRWKQHGVINAQGKRICRRCNAESQRKVRQVGRHNSAPETAGQGPRNQAVSQKGGTVVQGRAMSDAVMAEAWRDHVDWMYEHYGRRDPDCFWCGDRVVMSLQGFHSGGTWTTELEHEGPNTVAGPPGTVCPQAPDGEHDVLRGGGVGAAAP